MYGATAGGRRGKDLYNMDIITPELQAKPISIRKLEMKTNFSRRELQTIYQGFKRVCPTGYATKETFTQVYASFFPSRSSSAYAQMCFRVFDKDGAGKLSFEQFACCLSRIMRGTDLDKIDWIFALYDQNGDGYITRTEVTEVATAIFDLVRHKPDKDPQAVESRVNTMFQTYDLDHDGKISKEEFVSVSTKKVHLGYQLISMQDSNPTSFRVFFSGITATHPMKTTVCKAKNQTFAVDLLLANSLLQLLASREPF